MIYWRRKKDGVLVKTRARRSGEWGQSQVLATRMDNGHGHWISWDGLTRKYEQVDPAEVY